MSYCKLFNTLQGCPKGAACNYIHPTRPCNHFNSSRGCRAGTNCTFSHKLQGQMNTSIGAVGAVGAIGAIGAIGAVRNIQNIQAPIAPVVNRVAPIASFASVAAAAAIVPIAAAAAASAASASAQDDEKYPDELTVINIIAMVCAQQPTNSDQVDKVVISVDRSGSTAINFCQNQNARLPGQTVLQKELAVAEDYIMNNYANYNMSAFDHQVMPMTQIVINRAEGIVQIPMYQPGGSTMTHLALRQVNQMVTKPNTVILITDGQTNSSAYELQAEIAGFRAAKIKLIVIAVSANQIDMNTIPVAEEKRIPGMDLIEFLGNAIDSLIIYNQFHKDQPFIGAISSEMNKNKLMFLGGHITVSIPEFIHRLINMIELNKIPINWGANYIDFKKMVSEIGKLLTALFPTFPESHPFIGMICQKLNAFSRIPDMTAQRVYGLLEYGFVATKQQQPIVLTNVEQHVKDSSVKHQQFSDAIGDLTRVGTTGECSDTIGLNFAHGMIILNPDGSMQIDQPLGEYPNSRDQFGNSYFTTNQAFAQGTRIGMRAYCGTLGFPEATKYANPIFFAAHQMFMMWLAGHNLDSPAMIKLQKLAQIQTGMEIMVAQGQYSGKSLIDMWREGMLPRMYFKNPQTHTTLYTDKLINPLGLSELIWWASMSSMLGIFDEQMPVYKQAVEGLGIANLDANTFLDYMRTNFSNRVVGNLQVVKVIPKPKSIFTLDDFESDDMVWMLQDHGAANNMCTCKTIYSDTELMYVMTNGCVWCKYVPSDEEFVPYHITDPNDSVRAGFQLASPLVVRDLAARARGSIVHAIANPLVSSSASSAASSAVSAVSNQFQNMAIRPAQQAQPAQQATRLIRINMIGITGAGKSTWAFLAKQQIDQANPNAQVLIVSSDKWKKQGRDDQANIHQELMELDQSDSKLKVVIIDLCNDRGIKTQLFGYDFSRYESLNVYPNMDPQNKAMFPDYADWCLRNVLSRSAANANTNYWLNPITSGLETCIMVHNAKTIGIKRQIQNMDLYTDHNVKSSMATIQAKIAPGADRFAQYLATKSLATDVAGFISRMKI